MRTVRTVWPRDQQRHKICILMDPSLASLHTWFTKEVSKAGKSALHPSPEGIIDTRRQKKKDPNRTPRKGSSVQNGIKFDDMFPNKIFQPFPF